MLIVRLLYSSIYLSLLSMFSILFCSHSSYAALKDCHIYYIHLLYGRTGLDSDGISVAKIAAN